MKRIALFSALTVALCAQSAPEQPKPEPAKATTAPTPQAIPAPKATTAPSAQPSPTASPATAPAPVQVPPKEEAIPEDQVIARMGKRIIHEKDFQTWLKTLAGPKRFEQMAKTPSSLTRPRQQFLDLQVLVAKARKQRLQELPEFKKEMEIQQDQILAKFLMNEERDGSEGQRMKQKMENPTEEELKAYFDQNIQRFETPEKFTARHLLIGIKGSPRMGDKGLTEDEAKARITKIQKELKDGKKFEDLVKEFSDDPGSKNTGGLYKEITYGSFAKEFEEAVRSQELGKVGEPVKTTFGYHLILVEGRTPKQPAEFDKVKDRLKQQMQPERKESLFKSFLEDTRKEVGFTAGAETPAETPKEASAKPVKKIAKKTAPKP